MKARDDAEHDRTVEVDDRPADLRAELEQVAPAGMPVRGVLVWAPCSGSVGMSVSVFSCAGKVTAGFLTDAGLVPDPQGLADDFRRELLALRRRARAAADPG